MPSNVLSNQPGSTQRPMSYQFDNNAYLQDENTKVSDGESQSDDSETIYKSEIEGWDNTLTATAPTEAQLSAMRFCTAVAIFIQLRRHIVVGLLQKRILWSIKVSGSNVGFGAAGVRAR